MNKKLIIGISLTAGTLLLGGLVIYPAVMRILIRQRLDLAYQDPGNANAAGGLDKLLVQELFDPRVFERSGKATLSRVQAREKARQIWENYGAWLGSDSTAVLSAFNGLGHVHDVSKIAYEFQQAYQQELLSVLKKILTQPAQYNLLIGKLMQLPKE